jgi:large subunit ribosomal protein L5
MNRLNNYYEKIIKHDLLNKFNYTNLNELPKIEKIVLNFGCKNFELKKIATALFALELITSTKSVITKSTSSNIKLKIRKGQPVGCVAFLKKEKSYLFLSKLTTDVFPKLKNFTGLTLDKKNKKSFSFTIKELIIFNELESHFYLFSNLPPLNITVIVNSNTHIELQYLINSFKIPLKK